jgi:hypothetical protein
VPDERRSKLQKHGSPLRHIYRVVPRRLFLLPNREYLSPRSLISLKRKFALFKKEKESARRTARSHITLEKSSKNYIRCENEPSQAARRRIFHVVRVPRQLASWRGEGGVICGLIPFNNGLLDLRAKINMKMDNDVLLLCYLDKICLTLTGNLWRALASLYSEGEAI